MSVHSYCVQPTDCCRTQAGDLLKTGCGGALTGCGRAGAAHPHDGKVESDRIIQGCAGYTGCVQYACFLGGIRDICQRAGYADVSRRVASLRARRESCARQVSCNDNVAYSFLTSSSTDMQFATTCASESFCSMSCRSSSMPAPKWSWSGWASFLGLPGPALGILFCLRAVHRHVGINMES